MRANFLLLFTIERVTVALLLDFQVVVADAAVSGAVLGVCAAADSGSDGRLFAFLLVLGFVWRDLVLLVVPSH